MSLPSSYSDAKNQGAPKYFTGMPCKFGHVSERRTSNQCCIDCERLKSEKWKSSNPAKAKESNALSKRKRYEAMTSEQREAGNEYRRQWRNQNRDKVREYVKRWRDSNIVKARADELSWAKENLEKHVAKVERRRAAELKATPSWIAKADHDEMEVIYAAARMITKLTGVLHEVDHIVPISGKQVCGLHVPWNLRVVTGTDNRRKSNKHG
jgi:hypothetical protein